MAGLEHLKADLADAGISGNQLVEATGIARMTFSHMLSGGRAGTIMAQRMIATFMDRDPGYYFPRSERELCRAEALHMGENSSALAARLRAQATALDRAADAIEDLAS
jgi:transcriptional regulator with XRE-family HTH domain